MTRTVDPAQEILDKAYANLLAKVPRYNSHLQVDPTNMYPFKKRTRHQLKNGDPCPYESAPTEFNECYADAWDHPYWNTVCKYRMMPPTTFDPEKDELVDKIDNKKDRNQERELKMMERYKNLLTFQEEFEADRDSVKASARWE